VFCVNRVFICCSTDAIGMQIGAGVQKLELRNVLHHSTEKGPKLTFLGHNVEVGTSSLPLKHLKTT